MRKILQEFTEFYGIAPYKLTDKELVYYANHKDGEKKHHTYKCVVKVIDGKAVENRTRLKRLNKQGYFNI